MSTASSLGKLIKLKCLTGNHAKVKEMLCKLLLAPTFLGVWRRLSADVCGLGSGVAEQSKNVENWIVTVDFAACTSGRKWTFNNSTIWGPGPVSCTTKIPGSLRDGTAAARRPHWDSVCLSQMSRESFDYNLSQMRYITSLTMFNECRCFHAGAQRVTEWFNENKMMRITCCGHYSRTELGPIKHLCESDRPDSTPRHRHPKQQMREFLRHLDACGSFIYFNECLIS